MKFNKLFGIYPSVEKIYFQCRQLISLQTTIGWLEVLKFAGRKYKMLIAASVRGSII